MNVIVMIGIPGSGKSTWVARKYPEAMVCSADMYHTRADGVYDWKPENAAKAHKWCLTRFLGLLQDHNEHRNGPLPSPDVVVDNTNTTLDQIAPYIAVAQAHDIDLEIVYMDTPVKDVANVHDVPFATVRRMADQITTMRAQWPRHWPLPTRVTR